MANAVIEDDEEFNLMVERGTKAWADVPDATAWLEDLRGNDEHEKDKTLD